mgnify:CR=1 FL=1
MVDLNMDENWVTQIPGCPKKFNEARTTFCGKSLETIISKVFPEIFGIFVKFSCVFSFFALFESFLITKVISKTF